MTTDEELAILRTYVTVVDSLSDGVDERFLQYAQHVGECPKCEITNCSCCNNHCAVGGDLYWEF